MSTAVIAQRSGSGEKTPAVVTTMFLRMYADGIWRSDTLDSLIFKRLSMRQR